MKVRSFSLEPFPGAATPPGIAIGGSISRFEHVIAVRYELSGDTAGIAVPESSLVPERRDGLWKETCFELFVAEKGRDEYREFNLSPAGHWNIYHFDGYRKGMREDPAFVALPFHLVKGREKIVLSLEIDADVFVRSDSRLELGASAVIVSGTGTSCWAMVHPGNTPDFHRRDAFTVEL